MFLVLLLAELLTILVSHLLAVCDCLGHKCRLLEEIAATKWKHPQSLPLLPPADHLPSLLGHIGPRALIQ